MNFAALGFFIFLSVVWVCDTWLFSQGYNSSIHTIKSDDEKRIKEAKIKVLEGRVIHDSKHKEAKS